MARKINKVKADIRSYPPYIIMGQPKVGKTTLFRDLVLLLYKDPSKGLLISFGDEEGFLASDDLQYEEAKTWDDYEDENGNRGLRQIIDEVIETQGTDEQIEMVAFDTYDELIEVATKQVFEEHREQYGTYPKSLNDALGGFQRGHDRVCELVREEIGRLRSAKIAVFILAHTKIKTETDPLTGLQFEQITNNLTSKFYTCISGIAQMIVNIVYERKIEDVEVKNDKKKNEAGKIISSDRVMVFCNNPFVEAGGRFSGLPEKLPLSAENFMEAFNLGVKNSSKSEILTDASMETLRKQEQEENNKAAKESALMQETKKKMEVVREINSLLKADPNKAGIISELIKKAKIKNFSEKEIEKVDIAVLEEMREALSQE